MEGRTDVDKYPRAAHIQQNFLPLKQGPSTFRPGSAFAQPVKNSANQTWLRRFEFSQWGKEFYGLPYGLEGDVEDPTQPAPSPDRTIRNAILGRNAARAYGIDPDAARNAISCDEVNGLRQHGYLDGVGTLTESAPLASNSAPGARTRREVMQNLIESPWSP